MHKCPDEKQWFNFTVEKCFWWVKKGVYRENNSHDDDDYAGGGRMCHVVVMSTKFLISLVKRPSINKK